MKASIFGRRMEVIPTRLREVCHDERYIINKPVSLNKLYLIWPQITMGETVRIKNWQNLACVNFFKYLPIFFF